MRPTRSLLTVLALATSLLSLSPGAGSQPAPSGDVLLRWQAKHCSRLLWQFDGSVARMLPSPTLTRARASRNEGEKLCNRGKWAQGVPLLESALRDIGVNPISPP